MIADGRADYDALLRAGVHILQRRGIVLHAKIAVIKRDNSFIGSYNLDRHSVVCNNEINAVFIEHAFGCQMETLFREDAARSSPVRLLAWQAGPLGERLEEWLAGAIEPLP